jgi:hypothetical protein
MFTPLPYRAVELTIACGLMPMGIAMRAGRKCSTIFAKAACASATMIAGKRAVSPPAENCAKLFAIFSGTTTAVAFVEASCFNRSG